MEQTEESHDGASSGAGASAKIPLSSWYALALLFLVNMFAYGDRMALAMLQEQIKAELHTTDQQMGLLLGLAFALFYSVLGIPLARLADRSPSAVGRLFRQHLGVTPVTFINRAKMERDRKSVV